MTDDRQPAGIREHYGAAARKAAAGEPVVGACGGADPGAGPAFGPGLYPADALAGLPAEAVAGSIGCADPVALAELQPGEDVLDLGSGGGIDVLLSARRVGPDGRVYGVDMTPEMSALARANQERAGVANAEFLEGRIEAVPLPDRSVDVVVSNCVINLSTDKDAVFSEAFRVLRPNGRLALADVVAPDGTDRQQQAGDVEWCACTAGALTRDDYRGRLEAAGFDGVDIVDSHEVGAGYRSVFVRAGKPRTA